jgi:hypothetical protein
MPRVYTSPKQESATIFGKADSLLKRWRGLRNIADKAE